MVRFRTMQKEKYVPNDNGRGDASGNCYESAMVFPGIYYSKNFVDHYGGLHSFYAVPNGQSCPEKEKDQDNRRGNE